MNQKVKKKHNLDWSKIRSKFNKNNIQFIITILSLFISITSMLISCSLQTEVNDFTENMGHLNYDIELVSAPDTITSVSTGNVYTISPFVLKKVKGNFSGKYGKYYFAYVSDDDNIELLELNNQNTRVAKIFSNGSTIMFTDTLPESFDDSFENISFLFGPGIEDKWYIFHIILQGYNGDKVYHTMLISLEPNGLINSELFSYENIYDRDKISNFLKNSNVINLTTDELIEKIENERNILISKLTV